MNPTLNTVDLVVDDLDAAMTFYARLGLHMDVDEHTRQHAQTTLDNGLTVMLDTVELRGKTLTRWGDPTSHPRAFLAFEFPSPAAVDAEYAELTDAGYPGLQPPYDAFWGMRYATVTDPSGNGVDLYAVLPAD